MSIINKIQSVVEREMGLDPEVIQVVEALHREVEGKYDTAHGLSHGFTVDRGTGQGCHNGPARAKLTLALAQRAVTAECAGYKIREGAEGRIPQL
jgi:hypothetical protein